VATVAAVAWARHRVWWASGPPGPDPEDPPELDLYEIAYLNGGPALVATTAAVGLLRAGHLAGPESAAGRRGTEVHLRPVAPPRHPHPVERAVYDLVAAGPSLPFHDPAPGRGPARGQGAVGRRRPDGGRPQGPTETMSSAEAGGGSMEVVSG
jgi:uncharacterized protein (TIGR04222 family)